MMVTIFLLSIISPEHHRIDNDHVRSRHLENAPLVLWPGYRVPGLVSVCLWALLHLVAWLG